MQQATSGTSAATYKLFVQDYFWVVLKVYWAKFSANDVFQNYPVSLALKVTCRLFEDLKGSFLLKCFSKYKR